MAKNKGKGAEQAPADDQTENTQTETTTTETTTTETNEPVAAATTETAPAAEKGKSIVPKKYQGRYKAGQRDALGTFIDSQCVGKDGFEFAAFFLLCRKNGIAEDKVAHYEKLVADKAHGIEGRARMTLRNMLATPARKNGKLIALDGTETPVEVLKPALTGAAAKAAEAASKTEDNAGASEQPATA